MEWGGISTKQVVAVIATLADGREQVGSGFLALPGRVVTAAHCTVDKRTQEQPAALSVVRAFDGERTTARVRAASDEVDVAVLEVTADWWPHTAMPAQFGRVDRSRSGELHDCETVGYPVWQFDPASHHRDLAEFHGTIRRTEDAGSHYLVMRDRLLESVAAEAAFGPDVRSSWGGLSGALVFYAGIALGVVVQHQRRQGRAAIRIVPFDHIAGNAHATVRAIAVELALPSPESLPLAQPAATAKTQAEGVRAAGFALPPEVPHFTDRQDVVSALRRQLLDDLRTPGDTPTIAALSGPGGIGKTALALHVARDLRSEFAGGAMYLNLHGLESDRLDPHVAMTSILQRLGVVAGAVPESPAERVQMYNDRLSGMRMLLVLDNARDERQVRPLIPWSRTNAAIVTSRTVLAGLEEAHLFRLDVLAAEEAVLLLSRTVGDHRVASSPADAAAIVTMCGYLPLAVRICGRRLAARPGWSLATLRRRLEDERQRLAELYAGDLEVRASFQLSYADRNDEERSAFRRLGVPTVHNIPCWLLPAIVEEPAPDAGLLLEHLADAELIKDLDVDASGVLRYQYHDLLRLFARQLSAEEDPPEFASRCVERAAGAYLYWAERADAQLRPDRKRTILTGPAVRVRTESAEVETVLREDPLAWFDSERESLVALTRQTYDCGLWDATWELAGTLSDFCDMHGHWHDWATVNQLGLSAATEAGDIRAQGYMLHQRGVLDRLLSRLDDGADHHRGALARFREVGDRIWEAHTIREIGIIYTEQGRLPEALTELQHALGMFRELDLPRWTAYTLYCIGEAHRAEERREPAGAAFAESLAIARRIGDDRVEAMSLYSVGRVLAAEGRWDEAALSLEASLAAFSRVGDRLWVARNHLCLGDIAIRTDGSSAAVTHWSTAVRLLEDLGAPEAATARRRLDENATGEGQPPDLVRR
ncbi:tetratricopeptide repeat protein [Paractinoplanes rhizophilus]|uniref:Tetratricopeptide repeat protein n=1 Tax=Paractinoplanes rhizophilus TaxID=1416877 RepID=A0ABW2I4R0_9ACTN